MDNIERNNKGQGENREDDRVLRFRLATAYVPYQQWGRLFPLDEALMRGTIFPELYRPYKEE